MIKYFYFYCCLFLSVVLQQALNWLMNTIYILQTNTIIHIT